MINRPLKTVNEQTILIKGKSSLSNLSKSTTTKPEEIQQNDTNLYNSKEYFQFNQYSYFDIEREMVKYRLPQVSNKGMNLTK